MLFASASSDLLEQRSSGNLRVNGDRVATHRVGQSLGCGVFWLCCTVFTAVRQVVMVSAKYVGKCLVFWVQFLEPLLHAILNLGNSESFGAQGGRNLQGKPSNLVRHRNLPGKPSPTRSVIAISGESSECKIWKLELPKFFLVLDFLVRRIRDIMNSRISGEFPNTKFFKYKIWKRLPELRRSMHEVES